MVSANKKIFSQPSFRHCTILSKIPKSLETQAVVNAQKQIMGPLWKPMLNDLTDLFQENEVKVVDAEISGCKPEKTQYEGLVVKLPSLLVQYGDFDANFRVALTLCVPPNYPKVWCSYSMTSYEGKNGGLDAETARKFFDCFLPLAQKTASIHLNYYAKGMKAEGIETKARIEHFFDMRTVGIKKKEFKGDIAKLASLRSAYIDEVLKDPLKFSMLEECFRYLPPEIRITKRRTKWFGLSTMIGDQMADFLYYRTSTDNGRTNTYAVGVCPDLGRENNAPAVGSSRLMRSLSINL
ncbi:hypothetical protein COV19_00930 [Candidatus Woesearchaeota archaeon CG10_big_fil_rev_8_21_14_0_10_44_13]|nr:MAG: hypothetical protein COV19_00930 [Candidatus Woesearchaeota archaeon CG10_big_fil_rev_8_21_14_0_10_44_13]